MLGSRGVLSRLSFACPQGNSCGAEPSWVRGRSPWGHVTLLQPLDGQEDPGLGLPGGSVVKIHLLIQGLGTISGLGAKIPHAIGKAKHTLQLLQSLRAHNWRA